MRNQFSLFAELVKNTGTEYAGVRHRLMSSLGGIPSGHPVRWRRNHYRGSRSVLHF